MGFETQEERKREEERVPTKKKRRRGRGKKEEAGLSGVREFGTCKEIHVGGYITKLDIQYEIYLNASR